MLDLLIILLIMSFHRLKCTFKVLVTLSALSGVLIASLVITVPIFGQAGFGKTYETSPQSNNYFTKKYQTSINLKLRANFLTAVLAAACAVVKAVLVIKTLQKIKRFQQNSSQQDAACVQFQAKASYLITSSALFFMQPTLSFYLSILIQEQAQHILIRIDWIIVIISIFIAFVAEAAQWIIIVKLICSINTLKKDEQQKSKDLNNEIQVLEDLNSIAREVRFREEKPIQTKSTFEMEGAQEIYETKKQIQQQTSQNNEKVLFSNTAIPLFVDEANHPPQSPKKIKKNRNAHSDKIKNQLLEEISKRKKKFRQLNPFKRYTIKEQDEEENEDYWVDRRQTRLPKSYQQYIRQAQKPPRKIIVRQQVELSQDGKEKLTNSLAINSILDNPRVSSQLKEKALMHGKQEELVFQNILRVKRPTKPLFQQFGLRSRLMGEEEQEAERRMTDLRKAKTREDKIMNILKRKYSDQVDLE